MFPRREGGQHPAQPPLWRPPERIRRQHRVRASKSFEKLLPRLDFPLIPSPIRRLPLYSGPLNAALAAKPLQGQMKGEGTSLAERPDALIVATPRQAKLQAIVLVKKAEAVPHRRESVGDRKRVLFLIGEVEHGCAEHRPVAVELHPAGQAQLFLVAQI